MSVQVDLFWTKAFHLAALDTIEMGVWLMIGVWGDTVTK